MSEFEDNLWLSVVREHGDELARTGRMVHKHRKAPRPQLLAGTTLGLAAIATTAALLLGASTSSPAFAVTRNPNGTVTVDLMKPSGIAGANERLAAMGVRAQIRALAKQPPTFVCPGGTVATVTFDPASIPTRQALVITPSRPSSGDAAAPGQRWQRQHWRHGWRYYEQRRHIRWRQQPRRSDVFGWWQDSGAIRRREQSRGSDVLPVIRMHCQRASGWPAAANPSSWQRRVQRRPGRPGIPPPGSSAWLPLTLSTGTSQPEGRSSSQSPAVPAELLHVVGGTGPVRWPKRSLG